MTVLPKDIWQVILSKINLPKDYLNVSLVCKNASKASKILKNTKAKEFSKLQMNYIGGQISQKYYTLPNDQIHGKFIKYDDVDGENIIKKSVQYFAFGRKISKSDYKKYHKKLRIHQF
jgi:hypothetical protein